MTTDVQVREAKLRPEWAALYPGVDPDIWYIAATLAEHLVTRHLCEAVTAGPPPARIMDPAHFEFRGEGDFAGGRLTRDS